MSLTHYLRFTYVLVMCKLQVKYEHCNTDKLGSRLHRIHYVSCFGLETTKGKCKNE